MISIDFYHWLDPPCGIEPPLLQPEIEHLLADARREQRLKLGLHDRRRQPKLRLGPLSHRQVPAAHKIALWVEGVIQVECDGG